MARIYSSKQAKLNAIVFYEKQYSSYSKKFIYKQLKRKKSYHKVPSMYSSHLHWLTRLQPQLFHNVLLCSANFLLCSSIGDRADF